MVITLPNSASIKFARIRSCPDGFRMGSRGYETTEEPVHNVVIENDFYLGETTVTLEQFQAWTQAKDNAYYFWRVQNKSVLRNQKGEHTNHHNHLPVDKTPVDSVSWHEAMGYCDWLNNDVGCNLKGFKFTLPSEAQWEYACRGGCDT